MTKKKAYDAPVVKSEPIKVGVFGGYGGCSSIASIDWNPWKGHFFKRRRRRR